MRKTLLQSAILSAVGMALAAGGASAQSGGTGTTQSPPSGNASSQMPQPTNSAPSGAGVATPGLAGSAIGGTSGSPAMEGPSMRSYRSMRGDHPHAGRMHRSVTTHGDAAGMDDGAAPPTTAYRGGMGSPLSTRATNLTPSARPEALGSRLPDPMAASATPRDLLEAAQRALNQGRTGAAQEALERAETRVLSRTTDPSMASQPDGAAMVQNIAQARKALGARDMSGAKQAIAMAMEDRVPPRGPATGIGPASGTTGTY